MQRVLWTPAESHNELRGLLDQLFKRGSALLPDLLHLRSRPPSLTSSELTCCLLIFYFRFHSLFLLLHYFLNFHCGIFTSWKAGRGAAARLVGLVVLKGSQAEAGPESAVSAELGSSDVDVSKGTSGGKMLSACSLPNAPISCSLSTGQISQMFSSTDRILRSSEDIVPTGSSSLRACPMQRSKDRQ